MSFGWRVVRNLKHIIRRSVKKVININFGRKSFMILKNSLYSRGSKYLYRVDHEFGQKILTEVDDDIWMVLDMSNMVERDIYYKGFYRPWVWEKIEAIFRPGMNMIDVGANVGCYTLYAAKILGSDGKVFGIEPDPFCYEKLKNNVSLNRCNNIVISKKAVSDKEGRVDMYLNSKNNKNEAQSSLRKMYHHDRVVEVQCTTLDNIKEKMGIEKVDIIKVDTQGAELLVLKGATKTIEKDRPFLILRLHEEKCNEYGNGSGEIIEHILKKGYKIEEIHYRKETRIIEKSEKIVDGTFVAKPNGRDAQVSK